MMTTSSFPNKSSLDAHTGNKKSTKIKAKTKERLRKKQAPSKRFDQRMPENRWHPRQEKHKQRQWTVNHITGAMATEPRCFTIPRNANCMSRDLARIAESTMTMQQ
eukprot:1260480-Ditylum_brightwellii.AAC.1